MLKRTNELKKKKRGLFAPQSIAKSLLKNEKPPAKQAKKRGLFAPKSIAKSLLKSGKQPAKQASPRQEKQSHVSISIDGTEWAKTLLKAGVRLFSIRHERKLERESQLDQGVLSLAKRLGGLLGVPDLLGFRVCNEIDGRHALDRLSRRGRCSHLCDYKEESIYVFPEFIQRVWICEYCDSNFPIEKDHSRTCFCSNCTAPMEIGIL